METISGTEAMKSLTGANSKYTGLRWIDDGTKLLDPK
jgi:hypothetical protein